MPWRLIILGLVVITTLVLLAWLLGDVINEQWVDVYVRGQGVRGELIFLCIGGLLVSVGLSRQIVAFMGGYSFGFAQGVLLSMLAVVAGCVITFYVARFLLHEFLVQRFSERIRKIDSFIHDNTFSAALMIRMLPAGSNWMVNIAAGASSVRSTPFFLGSSIGYIPQMLIFALLGSGTQVNQFWQIAIAIILFIVAAMMSMYLYRKYQRGLAH